MRAAAALDGVYIIRTSMPKARIDAPACVRNDNSLANVERAFGSLKTIDLKVHPIHHRTADHACQRAIALVQAIGLSARHAPQWVP